MEELRTHPAADLLPTMNEADIENLALDMMSNGQLEPIMLVGGRIIDGRARYRACLMAEIIPITEEWSSSENPIGYAMARNLPRHKFNPSQRALLAARIMLIKPGVVKRGQTGDDVPATREEAAKMVGISKSMAGYGRMVLAKASPQELAAVQSGRVSVTTVGRRLSTGQYAATRIREMETPKGQRGKNPERIQHQKIKADIYGKLRDALAGITSLPRTSDVMEIVRTHDKNGVIKSRLSLAMQWLKEFSDEWDHHLEK